MKSLNRALRTEYDIFRNTSEELLEGLVPAPKMALLLQNPGGSLWKDPAIANRLKSRLQSSYAGYVETVVDVQSAINEFQNRLKLKDGKVQFDDMSAFKYEYKRLEFGLSKAAYEDLMLRIRHDNQSLCNLTQQSLRLEVSRVKRHRRCPDFKAIREGAQSLFATLRSGLEVLLPILACRKFAAGIQNGKRGALARP